MSGLTLNPNIGLRVISTDRGSFIYICDYCDYKTKSERGFDFCHKTMKMCNKSIGKCGMTISEIGEKQDANKRTKSF